MSVQKKSLISNHTATRKAIIATKPPSTNFSSNQPLASTTVFAGKPVAGKLVAGKPVAGKLVAGKLVAGKPVAGKLVAGKRW